MKGILVTAVLVLTLGVGRADPVRSERSSAGVADAQARVAQRMLEVEQRLLELRTQLREEQPDRADSVSRALSLSRERFIVSNMDRVRQLVDQGRYAKAARLQQRVLDDIADVARVMAAQEAGVELEHLRGISERLEGLLEEQLKAAGHTRDLAGQARASYLAAAAAQDRVRDAARDLLNQLRGAPGADDVASAVAHMLAAGEALRGTADAAALDAQLAAAGDLARAGEAIRQAIERLEEQLRAQRRARLRDLFRSMLARQQAIRTETAAVGAAIETAGRASRAQRLRIAALAQREEELLGPADEALALLEADGTTAALPGVLRQARADIAACAAQLAAGSAGPAVRALQQDVEAALQALLDTVSAKMPEPPAPSDEREERRQRKMQPPRLVGIVAELKLMRAVQARLNDRTARLQAARDGGAEPHDDLRQEAQRLADSQARLADMVPELRATLQRSER